jgi:hypothetical protein
MATENTGVTAPGNGSAPEFDSKGKGKAVEEPVEDTSMVEDEDDDDDDDDEVDEVCTY